MDFETLCHTLIKRTGSRYDIMFEVMTCSITLQQMQVREWGDSFLGYCTKTMILFTMVMV